MTDQSVRSGLSGRSKAVLAGGVLAAAMVVGSPARAEAQNFSVGVEFGRAVPLYGYAPPRAAYGYERWDWAREQAARERQEAFYRHKRREASEREQWRERERWREPERHEAWEHGYGYGYGYGR